MATGNRRQSPAKSKQRQASSKQRTAQPKHQSVPVRGSAVGDIIGLLIAILAIAMFISLVSPSTAPVTHATERFLTLCFGAGAMLFPLVLLVFAITFFIDDEDPISGRVAVGLALIMVSILSLVSLNAAGAEADPNMIVSPEMVGSLGGYVGGGVAWGLLRLVGRWVGDVILVGAIVVGAVICGFSISGAVTTMRDGARDAQESYLDALEERRELRAQRASERRAAKAARAAARGMVDDAIAYDDPEPVPYEEPATTFLGARKTTVLTRNRKQKTSEPATDSRPLRRPHPSLDTEVAQPAQPFYDEEEPMAASGAQTQLLDRNGALYATTPPAPEPSAKSAQAGTGNVPDFLKRGKRSRAATRTSDSMSPAPSQAAASASQAASEPERPAKQKAKQRPKAQPKPTKRPGEEDDAYELPPFSMLSSNPNSASAASTQAELDETRARLQATLEEFGLTSRVVDYTSGPLVTTFQVEMGEGERVNKITNLQDDIALSLAAKSVRIFAPIPGTSRVGVEIPNKVRQNVHLGDVLPYASGGPLEFAIGRDAEGRPVTADLASMPHLLVAGATGSGKSVMINSLIMSLLMRDTPKQVRLILVDPKRVEFSGYNGLPHLYVPVVTEPRQAASALQWAVSEMERRLKVFERAGARNINVYNEMCTKGKLAEMDNPPEPMPFMVIIIDELADLMMVAGKDVEASIVRIAQLARAAGIHLVLATQRPSANVVTGLIKSNIETRIALSVASGTDSRVILDQVGAQRLLGNGDMLFKERGGNPRRALGCYVSDPEIEEVVDFIRAQGEPDYHEEILSAVVPGQPSGSSSGDVGEEDDPLIWEAAQIVVESQLGSTSGLQRRLKVGYARAGRIMDMLESKGVVGPPDGSKPREVLLDMEGLEELRALDAQYREV